MENKYQIINGDCREVINKLKINFDLLITSPPYNINKKYTDYNDMKDYNRYIDFLKEVFSLCRTKVLNPYARICINIGTTSVGGRFFTPGHLNSIMEDVGYKYRDSVVWNKQNIRKRTAYGSWLSPSSPYLLPPYEFILIYTANRDKKYQSMRKWKNEKDKDILREEFLSWTNSLWSFPGETRKLNHPAPFPEELPRRLIKLYSYKGDWILDPFSGIGTTCKVAKDLGRNCIGIDISEEYCEIARKRCGI